MTHSIDELVAIMAQLRDADNGCPWDLKQTFVTIAPYTIEEAYEVADAIERGDMMDLCDELGDLLLQVVFHSQMAAEMQEFDFGDVVNAICEKMIRRHPHVFADAAYRTEEELRAAWDREKSRERAGKSPTPGALDGVAIALPALMRAEKLQRRAARVGLDWDDAAGAAAKCREELDEVEGAMDHRGDAERMEEEIGDLLFACVNLARHLAVDAEQALRRAGMKFERRFRALEQTAATRGRALEQFEFDELDGLWEQVKRQESVDQRGGS